jgi:hypothetical protein
MSIDILALGLTGAAVMLAAYSIWGLAHLID